MRQSLARWLIGAALALAVVYGLLFGGGTPSVVHAGDPTPTSGSQTNGGDPGSGGGSHGGG